MDIMYTAMGIILLKTQPLLVFLGLGSSAIAVQIAALAAITLISIAVTIGIVVLMGYGLKKLINPEKIPLANEFVPKKVEIIDTPEIVTARQNLEMAQNTYSKVLVDEQTFRKKSEDLDINYWSYARQRAAKYKIERAEYKIDKAQKALQDKMDMAQYKIYKAQNEFVAKKVEIIDTPEIVTARQKIVTARQNLEMAQNTYSKVLVDEHTFRKKSEDPDINYWSYARQRAAKYKIERAEYKIDKAQKALKKLIITEKIKPYKNLS